MKKQNEKDLKNEKKKVSSNLDKGQNLNLYKESNEEYLKLINMQKKEKK